jgi:hypothetical protein
MLDIVQPKNDDVNKDETYDKVLGHENYVRNQPIIPVSCELNEPIVEWTDNKTILTGAFPDKFLFCQGVPNRLPTQCNWKHFLSITMVNSMILYSLLMVSINCSMHVAFETLLELQEKPGYFEKSWCVGQFRGILKTTNLGKRSPPLQRGKVPQCEGLLNSFNGGIHDSIHSF